ncbi:MAG: agmatinase [Armatimonadota bacterium]|nr:agmatinase [Armatimonadota bacterium]
MAWAARLAIRKPLTSVRYLASADHPAPDAAIVGIPYDRTQSHRRGAAVGPQAIREASHSIETYSPELDRDLQEVRLADLGDLPVSDLQPPAMLDAVQRAVASLDPAVLTVLLGGDHTVTVGAVRALAARHPDLVVVQFDAHADFRDEYEGSRWSHACTMRRIWEVVGDGRIVQLGVRSGTRDELAFAQTHCRWSLSPLAAPETVLRELHDRPVYLSTDIDVLDPAYAPGVGNPEPGGPSSAELMEALRLLGEVRVVAADVVETSPPHDPSSTTAVAAAKIVRELVLAFAGRRR